MVDAPGEVGQGPQRSGLRVREARTGVVAVAGHDDPDRQFGDAQRGLRPVERIAVAEPGHGAVLDEVAREQHAGVGDPDDDVVVGVPPAEEAELDPPVAELDVGGLAERLVGWVDDDLGDVGGDLGFVGGDLAPAAARRSVP